MDDVISFNEGEDDNGGVATALAQRRPGGGSAGTAGSPGADLRSRVIEWVQRGKSTAAAGVSTPYRLATLYLAQTRLIFPGRRTQGQPQARVRTPEAGAELLTLRTACGQDVAALFGRAMSSDGKLLPDAACRATVLFFYGNGHYLGNIHVEHLFGALRRIGVNVMIPEYVGYGLSSGEAGEAGCYATASAALEHLRWRRDIDPRRIVAAGASLGGAVAIDLASRHSVAGLVTLITFTSMADMARVVQPSVPIWRLIRHRFESEAKMPRVTCPTLIIHSTGDALVPYAMSDRLAAACGGPVSRLKIEGAGHSSVEMLEGGGGDIYRAMTAFLSRI